MTRILTADAIAAIIDEVDARASVEAILADLGNGLMEQTAPVAMGSNADDALFLPMTSRSDRLGMVAVKLMCDIPSNAGRWPTQRSTILVSSVETGGCLALLDGALITRHRTAATSAVATRHLARSDARTLGLVGAGKLAVEHARYITEAVGIEQINVWSRSRATVQQFREEVAPFINAHVVEVPSAREVLARSEIVCTLTPSQDPVIRGEWLQPGQHVNVVGARPRPTHREVDGAAMARSTIVVDNLSTAHAKSGDLLEAIREGAIHPDVPLQELGAVVAGRAAGRTRADEITLFDSVGMGAQDLAIAAEVIEQARVHGVGFEVPMSMASVAGNYGRRVTSPVAADDAQAA